MSGLSAALEDVELISFDCYGTLIDWESGIRAALEGQLRRHGLDWREAYFDRYVACEAEVEAGPYRSYREITTAAEAEMLGSAGLHDAEPALADSIPGWLPFPDSVPALQALKSVYRLAVVSNIDRDLIAASAERLGRPFEVVITAEDVRSYKPHPGHFERLLQVTGLDRRQILHAAQSRFHDVAPCSALGIACAWINRRGERPIGGPRPVAEFSGMAEFAEAVLAAR